MSKSNRSANTRAQNETIQMNILARIEQHLAVLAEPIRRQLQAEYNAQQEAAAGGEEE